MPKPTKAEKKEKPIPPLNLEEIMAKKLGVKPPLRPAPPLNLEEIMAKKLEEKKPAPSLFDLEKIKKKKQSEKRK